MYNWGDWELGILLMSVYTAATDNTNPEHNMQYIEALSTNVEMLKH